MTLARDVNLRSRTERLGMSRTDLRWPALPERGALVAMRETLS